MTAVLIGGALVAVVALLTAIARSNPGATEPAGSLLDDGRTSSASARPDRLVEWEGLILAAATSGRRGRERLGRQMERLVASALADRHGWALEDPRAAELLGPEWAFLRGGPPPAGGGTDVAAIARAVDVVLDRVAAGGRGPVA